MAIAISTWYAGNGPAVVATLLSTALFDYFFVEPFYTFEVSARDLPYFFIFVLWGVIVGSFAAVRRRIEDNPADPKHVLTVWKVGYRFVA